MVEKKREELRTYVYIWALAQLFEYVFASMARQGNIEKVQLILIGVSVVFPNLAAVGLIGRVFGMLSRLPHAFDAELLAGITDGIVALALCLNSVDALPEAMKWSLGIFYLAAGGLKLNTAFFLTPQVSCASTYAAQLISALGLPAIPFLIRGAGVITVLFELSIGFAVLLAPRFGVVLALALHLGIALTPPPNNIAGFGVITAVRCLWLIFPTVQAGQLLELKTIAISGLGANFLMIATQRMHSASGPNVQVPEHLAESIDFPAAAFGAIAAYIVSLLCISRTAEPRTIASIYKKYVLVTVATIATLAWCLLPIIFGLMDAASPNMFSNLRMSGGTNHLLGIPTGLLQQYYYDNNASVFAGGVLRVSGSNSTVLNSIHPGELTPVLTHATRQALADAGAFNRFFNSAVANIVGPQVMPTDVPLDLQYTVPAYELHRVLSLDSNPVQITMTKLDGPTGDEHWRATSGNHTVRLDFFPSYPHLYSCFVLPALTPCSELPGLSESEYAFFKPFLKPDPTLLNYIGSRLQLWNSYVVLPPDLLQGEAHEYNSMQLPCYGS